jgi:hypothetical protein
VATGLGSGADAFGVSPDAAACELDASPDGDSVSAYATPPASATVIHVESRNAASVNRGHKHFLVTYIPPGRGRNAMYPANGRVCSGLAKARLPQFPREGGPISYP